MTSDSKIRAAAGARKRTKAAKKKVPARAARRAPVAAAAAPVKEPRAGSKTALCRNLLLSTAGTTTADILQATGWPSVSVPQIARSCGLVLRTVKEKGSPTRYFATLAGAEAA